MTNKSLTEIEMKSIMGGYSFTPSLSSIDRFESQGGYRVGRPTIYGWLESLFRRW